MHAKARNFRRKLLGHELKANHILLHFNINVLQPLPITLCNNLYKLLSLTFVIIPNNHLGPHGIFSTLKDNIILWTCLFWCFSSYVDINFIQRVPAVIIIIIIIIIIILIQRVPAVIIIIIIIIIIIVLILSLVD